MSYVMDFWHAIMGVFTGLDLISIAIMVLIVLAAGWIMDGFEALLTTTVVAMVLFGVADYVRVIAMGHGQSPGTVAAATWHGFLGMSMGSVLLYAVIFAVGILIVQVIKQIVASR